MENKTVKQTKLSRSPAKRYDEEFKTGAVRLVVEQKRPVAQVASELGVTSETLRSWVKAKTTDPKDESMQLKAAQAEIKRLRKEAADQAETIEILKKAAAIFTKP